MKICIVAASLFLATSVYATERSLSERALHNALSEADYVAGEKELRGIAEKEAQHDQATFALGILYFMQSINDLGHDLYTYGALSDKADQPFLRLPVPKNPKPEAINYEKLGKILDRMNDTLTKA